ncbi:hypothetical protein TRM7557_03521 [Tritonibacter multivorans]|uniref:Phage tail assembly chaperone n=1 Tax=Tritonibacter multivorans TaxID=928856 RepID=A0A0N7M0W9_9RHOB|nr:rcc01693 family protein [Tritonibacter multivorans]MDA7420424.1 phage tail assembly chaperone [Tritonibacter multivorans]CUH81633.1 hypothetical protein TRM7557_03521 [Tritonibacter multivorans]SFC39765.1 phage conserved hypothetical protein [Tritonibacter multivorans]
MTGFNWPVLMRAGIAGLRLRPDQFWALTPHELRLMLGLTETAQQAMDRSRLTQLMRDFPDVSDLKEGS